MTSLDYRLRHIAGLLALLLLPAYALAIAVADASGIAIVALFLLRSALLRDWAWLRRGWVAFTLALGLYLLLRSAFSPEPAHALVHGGAWIRFPLLAAALSEWLLPDPQLRGRLRIVWTVTAALLALDTLAQYAFGQDALGHVAIPALPEGSHRLTGPFTSPKVGITLLWLAFPVIAVAARRHRGMAVVAWIGFAATIFLTGERMAFLLMLLGTLLLCLSMPRLRRAGAWVLLGIVAMVFALSQWKPTVTGRQVDSTLAALHAVPTSAYGQIWHSAWAVIEAHPLVGVGPRQFRIVCPEARYGDPSPDVVAVRCNLHPHQLYLEWLAETGLVGLTLFLCAMVAAFRRGWCALSDEEAPGLAVACALRLWPLATSASFFIAWAVLPFWIALGWWLSLAREKS